MPPVSVSGSGSVINSAANPATLGNALFAVATVASPAPARNAAMPAIAAAPDLPSDPPTISTCPYMPLLLSMGRGAKNAARSCAVVTSSLSLDSMAASGEPIGATITGPRVSCPNTCAGRGAVNVTIASARAIPSPDCAVIASESAPDGMSTATTGLPPRLIAAIASAYNPFTGGLNPVPRIASTNRSQFPRLRDDSACSSCALCTTMGRTGSRSNIVAASPFSSDGDASSSTSTTRPARCRRRATTNPSPPLLPLPHTTAMRSALL